LGKKSGQEGETIATEGELIRLSGIIVTELPANHTTSLLEKTRSLHNFGSCVIIAFGIEICVENSSKFAIRIIRLSVRLPVPLAILASIFLLIIPSDG